MNHTRNSLFSQRKIREAEEALKAQRQKEDDEKKKEKKKEGSFFKSFFRKEQAPASQGQAMEIGVPLNVKHEGHIGFDKEQGNFQVQNLPPQYQLLFDKLNETLKEMGVSGLTEKEAKFLLRSIAVVPATQTEEPKKRSTSASSLR